MLFHDHEDVVVMCLTIRHNLKSHMDGRSWMKVVIKISPSLFTQKKIDKGCVNIRSIFFSHIVLRFKASQKWENELFQQISVCVCHVLNDPVTMSHNAPKCELYTRKE
jgi:hypothetical protein